MTALPKLTDRNFVYHALLDQLLAGDQPPPPRLADFTALVRLFADISRSIRDDPPPSTLVSLAERLMQLASQLHLLPIMQSGTADLLARAKRLEMLDTRTPDEMVDWSRRLKLNPLDAEWDQLATEIRDYALFVAEGLDVGGVL